MAADIQGTFTPLRSVLYMPSANERALEKAKSLPCDAIILDLEDSVAPDAKPAARDAACAAVRSKEYGRRVLIIRVNSMDTQWHEDDLRAACAAGPDAIAVPELVAWAWAVNACTSTIAASLAALAAIHLRFAGVAVLAAGAYLLAAWVVRKMPGEPGVETPASS